MIITVNKTFEVPDPISDGQHGYVQYVNHMGDDLTPLYAARMSTGNPTGTDTGKDNRLRKRLYGDQHMSPFEMMEMIVEIQTMLFVVAHLVRHRTFSVNIFSARYAEMPELWYVPELDEIRQQDGTNHQMSGLETDVMVAETARYFIDTNGKESRQRYDAMLANGVARETARMVLPQNQYTRLWMKGDARCWLQFFNLRLRSDVQSQTVRVADAAASYFKALFPDTYELFNEFTLMGERLSYTELKALARAYNIENSQDILTAILGDKDGLRLYHKLTKE